jgi:AcrR family transcriptional regulator
MNCLAEEGYNRFSTGLVAARASLTRPAMLYHFASRQELLAATVNFLVRRRIGMFDEALAAASERLGSDRRSIRTVVVDISWDHARRPESIALRELAGAARTDPALAGVVAPALALFDVMRSESAANMPRAEIVADDFQLARDVVRLLTEGSTQPEVLSFDAERRLAALKCFVQTLVASEAGGQFLRAVAEAQKAAETRGDAS